MKLNRRSALGVGVAVPLVAACGSEEATTGSSSVPSTPGGSGATPGDTPSRAQIPSLGPASEIEVGGGKIFADESVVVTQPTAGEYKAFDARCTHQSCLVTRIDKGEIVCTCHFSKFAITDGSVQAGQASEPLAPVQITVTDGEIFLG